MREEAPVHYFDCEQCGETFEARRYHAKYCSGKCRTRASRQEKKYKKTIQDIHKALDWLKNNRSSNGREEWERDMMSISNRAANITFN